MHGFKIGSAVALLGVAALTTACGGGGDSDAGGGTPTPPGSKALPVITSQPAAASVLTDAPASFSVAASGTGLSYQWQRDGVAIAGATGAAYTTPPATWQDSGVQYSVVVSNADGSVTSSSARLDLALSAEQQAYEQMTLAPSAGTVLHRWNLAGTGSQISGFNYADASLLALAQSPLTHGPQPAQFSPVVNMTSTLALYPVAPNRVLKDGVVYAVPATENKIRVRYVGSEVLVETFAADGATVVATQRRKGYSWVDLAGTVKQATPLDMQHANGAFFSNPAILKADTPYATGSAYLKYSAVNVGDRYSAFDCRATTQAANISACETGKTLEDLLTVGYSSTSDARTYTLADGVIGTAAGVRMWIANDPRPATATASSSVQYRIYFEMGGNVYTGALLKDGAAIAGNAYATTSDTGAAVVNYLSFLVVFNKPALDSIKAALTF
jgi:hypothetical protein